MVDEHSRWSHEHELSFVVWIGADYFVQDAARARLEHLDCIVRTVTDQDEVAALARAYADWEANVELVGALESSYEVRHLTSGRVIAQVDAEYITLLVAKVVRRRGM